MALSPTPHATKERKDSIFMRLPAALLILATMTLTIIGALLAAQVALAKTITGTNGPNTLIGTIRPDQISGLRRGDYIDGMRGDDTLRGNQGNDRVVGRGGKDRISGGLHRDELLGGSANDTIRAADGYHDTVDCGPGKNATASIDLTPDTRKNCETANPPRP